jgi:hypothetical protein
MQKFHERTFDKGEIKRRMIEKASKIWQYSVSEIDSMDPLIGLLFEACSVELEKIANEIHSTSDRVIDRLASLMNPEVVDIIRPAHAIIQTRAIDPFTVVMPQEQFKYQPPIGFGMGYNSNKEFFFSPIMPFRIFDGEVKFVASKNSIIKIEPGLQQHTILTSKNNRNRDVEEYQKLYIGLDVSDKVKSLEGFTFFFDWINEPRKAEFYKSLSQTKWFVEETELPFREGIYPEFSESLVLDDEFDALKRIEKGVKEYYDKCFISLKSSEFDFRIRKINEIQANESKEKTWPIVKKVYPEIFETYFGKENLVHKLKGELVWIEVCFPVSMDESAFQNIYCSVNSFPVINRKLNKITYTLQENLNIIPLESQEAFLAVKNITDDENTVYSASPFTNLENLAFDNYTIRKQGIGRFDNRDAKELLYYVLELLQDESRSFAALGSDFLGSIIKELNQNIAQLDQQLKLTQDIDAKEMDSIPYISIRPRKSDNNLYIEFWSCDSEDATNISAGSRLSSYSGVYVDSERVYLLTSTVGGRAKLKETEKINALKRNLLTRSRIVTHEDIKASCWAFLDEDIKDLKIGKGFITSQLPDEGFIRCIEILLFPTRKSMDKDWESISSELKVLLESRSAMNLPYNILVAL